MLLSVLFFVTSLAYAGNNYDVALSKAQEAAYIQTGLANFEHQFSQYIEKRSKFYVQKLKIEKEVATILFGYKFYRNPSYTFRFRNNRSLSLNTNSLSYSFPIEDVLCVITKK